MTPNTPAARTFHTGYGRRVGAAQHTAPARVSRRVMPHSIDAEESVLGGILFSGGAIARVADFVEPEDFYDTRHQAIFTAMRSLFAQSRPIDIITVAEEMRQQGTISTLSASGSEAYLAELANKIASTDNIALHARIVRDRATARKLILVGSDIVDRGYGGQLNVEEYLEEAQRAVFEVAMRFGSHSYEDIKPLLHRAIKRLETRYHNKQAVTGVPTGYPKFDEMTAGLQPGDLIIVGGRPSMGKTSFAMNCAEYAAIEHGTPALVFSCEMSGDALTERLLASEARVDSNRLRTGLLQSADWNKLSRATKRISEAKICIDGRSTTLAQIRARALRWRSDPRYFAPKSDDTRTQHGLIVIDYLQLLHGTGRERSKEQEVSAICRGLKELAKELQVPVVVLSQLNRECESRTDKRPVSADLRDSGSIEQDADVICLMYRDEFYHPDTDEKGVAELIVPKQRNGITGTVRLAWSGQFTRFDNLAGGRTDEDYRASAPARATRPSYRTPPATHR
ncbi:MAG TPA: replicative DNA helicase [Pseudomonadota bacterium]|nr:replicative DNA helicase [Pseudomonadota bacterium]